MIQESRIPTIESGRRSIPAAVVDGKGQPARMSQVLRIDPNKRLLELEFENRILLNKLDKYHRVLARGVDFVSRDLPSNLEDIQLNYNSKTNYVNILQDRLAEVTRDAENQGKQELMERVRLLEVQIGDQRDTLDLITLKYIKLKQKFLKLQRDRQQVKNIIETSKAIRSAIGEFERFATISQKTLHQIDFQTFDLQMSAYEDQLKEETTRATKKNKKGNEAGNTDEMFETKKKEKLISSLQERVKELAEQLDEAHTSAVKKEELLQQDFAAKVEAEKKRTQSLVDEVVYKHTQRAKQLEEETNAIKERFKNEIETLTNKYKVESEEKQKFKDALALKEVEFDSVNKKYNEAKMKILKDQDRFKQIMADQKISMSKIMGSTIKMSAVSKSVLQQIEGFERKKGADGKDVVELDADQLAQVKRELQNLEEMSTKLEQLNEIKSQLEKEIEELEKTVNSLQTKLDSALNQEEKTRIELNLKVTEVKSLESKLTALAVDSKSFETQLKEATEKLTVLEKELNGERQASDQLKDKLEMKEKRISEFEKGEKRLFETNMQLEADLTKAKREISKLEESLKEKDKVLQSTNDQNAEINERLLMMKSVMNENKELKKQVDKLKVSYESEKKRNRAEEKNYINLISENLLMKEQFVKQEEEMKAQKAKYKLKISDLRKAQRPDELVLLEQTLAEKESNLEVLREDKWQKTEELMKAREKITILNEKMNELNSENLKLSQEVVQLANFKAVFEQMKSGLSDYLSLKEQTQALTKTNGSLKNEIDELNMQLLEARKAAEKLKIQLSKTDQQVEIAALRRAMEEAIIGRETMRERLVEVEAEKNRVENALKEASQDLMDRTKQNERFEARLKEVEDVFLGGTGKKSMQSFEIQAANAEIQKGLEERSQLQFKLSTLELLNAEQKNTIIRLEDKLQEIKAKNSMNVSLSAALEARDQQMFEMIVNTNRKQAEIENLKERISALEEQQRGAVNLSFHQSVEDDEFIQVNEQENNEQLNLIVADYRQKFKMAASKYDTKAELADLYRKVEYYHSSRQRDNGKSSLTGTSGFGRRSSIDGSEQRGDQKGGENIRELKEQLNRQETAIAMSAKREEDFLAKEQSYEIERKEMNSKVISLNNKLNANSTLIRELECTVEDLKSQLEKMRQSVKDSENKAADSNRLLIQRQFALNQANLDLTTKNAMLKIEADKSRASETEIKALKEENARLSRELESMNEGHLAAVNNLVAELEEEHVSQRRYRDRLTVLENLLSEAQRESKDNRSVAEAKSEEIARLKALISSQTDRIELLIRIQKLPPEGIKELKENTDLRLQKGIDDQSISDLKAQVLNLQKEVATVTKTLESEKEMKEKLTAELSTVRSKIDRYEKRFEEQRKLILAKNDAVSKMQLEILTMTEQNDELRETIVQAKLEKGELLDQVDFMKRQLDSVFERSKSAPSYNHVGLQTEEPSTEESLKQQLEQQLKQHQREVREYQRKIKVKNDRIKNLTETLDSFAPGSKRQITIETEKEVMEGKTDRIGKIAELEAQIVDLESKLASKEEVADNFVNLVYENKKNDIMTHVLIAELNAKCDNLEALNSQLQTEVNRLQKYSVQQTAEKNIKQKQELLEGNLAQLVKETNSENDRLKNENYEIQKKTANLEARIENLTIDKSKQSEQLNSVVESLNAELKKMRETNWSKLTENELFAEEIGHKNKQNEEARKEAQIAKEALNSTELELNSLKIKLREAEVAVDQLDNEKEQNSVLRTKLLEAKRELSEAQHQLSKEVSFHSMLEEQLKRFENVELPAKDIKIEDLRREASELRRLLSSQQKTISKNASKYVDRINTLTQENQKLKAKLGEAEAEEETLRQSTFVHDLLYQSSVERGVEESAPGNGAFKKKQSGLKVIEEGDEE